MCSHLYFGILPKVSMELIGNSYSAMVSTPEILVFLLENLQKPNISVVKHTIFLRLQRCSRLLHRAPFNDATHLWYPHIGWNPVVREDGGGENDGCLKQTELQITSVFFGDGFNMVEDVSICFNPALIVRQEKVSQAPGWANQATGAVLSHEWGGSSPVCCGFSPAESSRASHVAGRRNAQWWGMMPASEGFGRTF